MTGGKRILIAEDDTDISMVEEAYLEAAGFQTVIVADGAEVSSLLGEELFDLILLDLMLPGKAVMRYAGKSVIRWIFQSLW